MRIVGFLLLYSTCVILSFASALQRNFSRSQPELHQAVDAVSEQLMKISSPTRDWMEAFLVRLQHLASTLERKESQSFHLHSTEDELVLQLESLHKPREEALAMKKRRIMDEVAELRRPQKDIKAQALKVTGTSRFQPQFHLNFDQIGQKYDHLRGEESGGKSVNYWNSSHVTHRRNNTLLIMPPRVLRKHFRWYKDPRSRHYPFSHGALTNTIQKLHQNYLFRNDIEEGRAPSVVKSFYTPHPSSQQKNETTYSIISNEFSEEMKRQLRDGKILLLSDSVVHSNFTS